MRLAWFSPWPPDRSGVAGRSAELVPALAAAGHAIDVFVDEARHPHAGGHPATAPDAGEIRVSSAHDFVWRATRHPFDLVVYQLGNSVLHEFIWPYVFRWPGLAVLHDARLHHARAQTWLRTGDAARYRAAFAWNHPDVHPEAAELAVAGFPGTYYYGWPMVRDVVEMSRMVAVHSAGAAADLALAYPHRPIAHVTLGEGADVVPDAGQRAAARAAIGLPADTVAFGVFGALTPEKRLPQVLRNFRGVVAVEPAARLVLCGAPSPDLDVTALTRALAIDRYVLLAGVLDDDAFDRTIAAMDVSVNLRWPTALETSGPWLRALAAGRPTIITEFAHQSDVPTLDPRTWRPSQTRSADDPIAVGIDILDEDHSLALAFQRLATDQALRDTIGRRARAYWLARHTFARMRDEYLDLVDRARTMPPSTSPRSPAVEYDPPGHARALVAGFGDVACRLF